MSACNKISLEPHPRGLWSLWDMLDHWGYRYLAIGNALTHLEMGLGVHLGLLDDAKEMRLSDLQEDATARDEFLAKCHEIDALIGDQDLGAINGNLAALTAKIFVAGKRKTPLYAMDLLKDVQRLKNDFALILSKRLFYSLPSELSGLYGKPTLFGEAVAKIVSEGVQRYRMGRELFGAGPADGLRATPGSRNGNCASQAS